MTPTAPERTTSPTARNRHRALPSAVLAILAASAAHHVGAQASPMADTRYQGQKGPRLLENRVPAPGQPQIPAAAFATPLPENDTFQSGTQRRSGRKQRLVRAEPTPISAIDYKASAGLIRTDAIAENNSVVPGQAYDLSSRKRIALNDSAGLPEYPLGPGDVVEVIYQLTNRRTAEAYKIDITDELEFTFPYHDKFNSKATVSTDGKVDLPSVGSVEAAGKTITQLTDEVTSLYSTLLKEPVVRVNTTKSQAAIEELKKAITTSPRGQSRLEPVRPDGFISLPLVGDVRAAGLTVPQISAAVVEAYKRAGINTIDITVVLLEVRSPIAYVIGDVISPGPVVLQGPTDVWRLLASAGGFGPEADRRRVVVAKTKNGVEKRYVLDYAQWTHNLDGRHNVAIERGDIVYVTKMVERAVYVAGEVDKPGAVAMTQEQILTVSQAIASAGGVKLTGRECQPVILRRGLFNRPLVIPVDYRGLFDAANYQDPNRPLPEDVRLKAGDVIFVPRTPIGDFDKFAKTYFRDGIWTIIPFNVTANYNLGGAGYNGNRGGNN